MKKLLFLLFLVPTFSFADSKLTALTADTTAQSTDLIYKVDNPGGTPYSRSISLGNALSQVASSSLTASGVSPGNYTNVNVTINAQGIVTAASNGSTVASLPLPPGDTNYIQNTNSVQQATFSVISGSVTANDGWAWTGTGGSLPNSKLLVHFVPLPRGGGFGPQEQETVLYNLANNDASNGVNASFYLVVSTVGRGSGTINPPASAGNSVSLNLDPLQNGGQIQYGFNGQNISILTPSSFTLNVPITVGGSGGSNGQVLTSGGPGVADSWQTPSVGGGGYAVQPGTVSFLLNQGFSATNGTFTALSPGVMHIVANSSATSTGLVSLSTEVTGQLPATSIAAGSLGASVLASSFPATAVTAGSYTNTNLTVNAQGLITSASNGSAGGSPSGSNGAIQFSSNAAMGSSPSLSYSTATSALTVSSLTVPSGVAQITISTPMAIVTTSNQASTIQNGLIVSGGPVTVSSVTSAGGVAITASTSTNKPPAGSYGENGSSTTASATNLPATTNFGDLVSINLSSGSWILTFQACEQAAGATLTSGGFIGISTTSGNSSGALFEAQTETQLPLAATTDGCGSVVNVPFSFNVATTLYAKMEDAYTLGQPTIKGTLSWIRPY